MITDVIVIGAGNAALCAAIAARQKGAGVLVLEKAPREHRGGNSCLTLNMRFAYNGVNDLTPLISNPTPKQIEFIANNRPRYSEEEYYDDIMEVNNYESDPLLIRLLTSESLSTIKWLHNLGHRWTPNPNSLAGSLPLNMEGGGYAFQQHAFAIAERLGVQFAYNVRALELIQDAHKRIIGVRAATGNSHADFMAKAIVLACGGFEASAEMRARYLGGRWRTVRPRGVPYNTGDGLRMALEIDALPYGRWDSCHAAPQDATLPPFMLPNDHAVCFQQWRYSFPYGITVNSEGLRFFDEGETYGSLTYAKIGRAILDQPGAIAFQIFDAKSVGMGLIYPAYNNAAHVQADTLEALAESLEINKEAFVRTVHEFNQAVLPGEFKPYVLDGKGTLGLDTPKSNWALEINTPPFRGYPVVCGITFTFGGLKIDDGTRVMRLTGEYIPGLYAAGEMVGGLFYYNYPGGSGMMSGAVFGRKAGTNAATYALTVA